jgi:uncharacterized protein YqgC (DUF456 family)
MSAGVLALVYIVMIAGIAGSFLPVIPGSPLIVVGALIYALATDFQPVGPWRLSLLAALAVLAYALDYLSGALGTRKLGGSRWAMFGAIAGGLIGLFFGPFGILIGPIVGAIGVELLYRQDVKIALKSGTGAVLGVLLGVVAKLSISVMMVGLFTFWVVRG